VDRFLVDVGLIPVAVDAGFAILGAQKAVDEIADIAGRSSPTGLVDAALAAATNVSAASGYGSPGSSCRSGPARQPIGKARS